MKGKGRCKKHEDRPAERACLDPECFKEGMVCGECLTNEHKDCRSEFLLNSEDREKVEIQSSEKLDRLFREALEQAVEDRLESLGRRFAASKRDFLNGLSFEGTSGALTDSALGVIKRNFRIEATGAGLRLNSKLDEDPSVIKDSLETFEEDLAALIRNFLSETAKIGPQYRLSLDPDDFIGHPLIIATASDHGVSLKRSPSDPMYNYFCKVLQHPLEQCKIKVTVNSIFTNDRFLDMGIIDENRFRSFKEPSGFVNNFGGSSISFCGYSKNQLEGSTPTNNHTSTDGLKPGDSVIFDFTPGGTLKVTNESLKIDLVSNQLPPGKYYFFVVLYHPETSCTVYRIG